MVKSCLQKIYVYCSFRNRSFWILSVCGVGHSGSASSKVKIILSNLKFKVRGIKSLYRVYKYGWNIYNLEAIYDYKNRL